ncbi:MAG: cation:proton antiporter [Clostridia bacterium]|nr:cation:proton antiporter [Clostridia bacterium]
MSDSGIVFFCIQISLMLLVAIICKRIADKLNLPLVLGELVAGIIIGPTILGALSPHLYNQIFLSQSVSSTGREIVVKLGQLFFLFIIGLELNLHFLKQQKRNIACISISGILVPFALGTGIVFFLPGIWNLQAQNKTVFAFFIGIALSISALPVIARILIDLELLKTRLGTVILSAATINDLIGWIMFSIILNSYHTERSDFSSTLIIVAIVGVFVVGIGIFYAKQNSASKIRTAFVKQRNSYEILIILILLVSVFMETIGLHMALGAFIVGVAFSSKANSSSQVIETIKKFTNGFFAPVYFVSIGLKADFITNFDLKLVLIVTIVACIGKICGAFIGARIGKIPLKESLIIGFAMNARGAMEMILVTIAYEYKIIDQRVFVAMIIMAIVTTLISGPAIQVLLPKKIKVDRLESKLKRVSNI